MEFVGVTFSFKSVSGRSRSLTMIEHVKESVRIRHRNLLLLGNCMFLDID